MQWEQIAANWKQMTRSIVEHWGELTDEDIARIGGRRDELVDELQKKCGLEREAAEEQVRAYESHLPNG